MTLFQLFRNVSEKFPLKSASVLRNLARGSLVLVSFAAFASLGGCGDAGVEGGVQTTAARKNADGSWQCGDFTLSAAHAEARIARAKKFSWFYKPALLQKLQSNPCAAVLTVAHRGDVENAPQNTIPAVANAIVNKIPYIEIDVYLNSKDEPILLHDAIWLSGTNRECIGKNFEHEDWDKVMSKCDVSKGVGGMSGITAPLLKEVFERFRNKGSIFMVELKKSRNQKLLGQKVCELMSQYIKADERVITSFEDEALQGCQSQWVKKVRQVPLGRSVENEFLARAIRDGYHMLNTDLSAWSEDMAAKAAAKGIAICGYTLTTSNWKNDHVKAMKNGGACLMTDFPSDLMAKTR